MRTHTRSQSGLSLIEVLVGLVIMGLLAAGLTGAFTTMLRSSNDAEDQLSRSADAARIGNFWTRDVQNVDVNGVNGGYGCTREDASAGPPEVQLVTFAWNTASSATGGTRVASWVAVGTGANLEIRRRYCEADTLVSEDTVATRIGIDGQPITQTVRGPSVANPTDFCPGQNRGGPGNTALISDSCTIVVTGSFSYQITVARRVPEKRGTAASPLAPSAPTILVSATEARNGYIIVGWTAPVMAVDQPPVSGYRVFVYTDPLGNTTPVADTQVSGTSATIPALTNGTPYFVRVQAQNSVGWGELTGAYGPLTPDATGPDAPTIAVSPIEGDTSITLSWSPNSNNGGADVTEWVLTATPGSGTTISATVPHVNAQEDVQSGSISGLTNGVNYTVTVTGVNGKPGAQTSDPTGGLIPYGVPGPATGVTATAQSDGTILVSWIAPTFDGGRPILGYRVEVAAGPDAGPWPSAFTWYPATATSGTLSGLNLGSSYTFRVLTNNLRGYSVSTATVNPTLSAALPGPPTVTVGQAGAQTLLSTWTASAPNGSPVDQYRVRTTPATTIQTIAPPTLAATFSGLTAGTTYTVYVQAHNAAGWGLEASSSAVAGGKPNWAGATPNLSKGSWATQIPVSVSWNRPSNIGGACITAYRVEYSTDGIVVTSSKSLTATPAAYPGCAGEPSTSTTFDLPFGVQTRYFRVVAVNGFGAAYESATAWKSIDTTVKCTLTATEDSWVNEYNGAWGLGGKRGTNYGGDGELTVDKHGSQIFLKFDPRTVGGSNCAESGATLPGSSVVSSAVVSVYNTSPSWWWRSIRIARVTGAWAESGITYNNRPGYTNDTATVDSSGDPGWRTWWVNPSDVTLQRSGGSRFGWVLRDVDGNGASTSSGWRSRETDSKPKLEITFY